MTQQFFVGCRLPGMNEIIAAAKKPAWSKDRYAEIKTLYQSMIRSDIKRAGIKPVSGPVLVHFTWADPNARRDIDNIRAGAKFILDALVTQGILTNDTRKQVKGFADRFEVDKARPGVLVALEEV